MTAWGRNAGRPPRCRFERVEPVTGVRIRCSRMRHYDNGHHRGQVDVPWAVAMLGGSDRVVFTWATTPRAPLVRV